MSAPARLLAFALLLAAVFAAAWAIGRAVGPEPERQTATAPPSMAVLG